ncbi:hypothetical protein N027_06200 [Pseudomonas syringae USA007]|uniref:Lipoprotein n=1 Tax=Pseudomonas syringae USA007 TaxID=1357288 RepID=A0AAU8MCV8_PSESX|nr:hypothetical protein [Pseudomonas syringae]
MLKLPRLLAVFLAGLMAGCSSMPPDMALGSKTYSAQNAGLIVGALIEGGDGGTWFELRDINTGKTYGWAARDYYSAWLPAGEYELYRLGSRRGVIGAYASPLHFSVKQGELNYLGELVYGCSLDARPTALYGAMYCGLLALGECSVSSPSVSICVVDRQEQAVKSFLKKNPEFLNMPVSSSVMAGRQGS